MKLTIIKFQELYSISQSGLSEIDMATRLVQCFTGKSEDEIDGMQVSKFNKLCTEVQTLFNLHESRPYKYLQANGNWYRINFDITKMTAGRYVEVTTFSKDIINNLHKVMASICTPVKITWMGFKELPYDALKHEDYANDMLDAPFYKAYQSMLFFSAVFRELIRSSRGFLVSQMKAEGVSEKIAVRALEDLQTILDGSIQPKWLKSWKVAV
jgi:hypothetical protein